MFKDRQDAGQQLAQRVMLAGIERDAVVLGIPRGGVVVAAEVARALDLPLDVIATAKVGAPGNPEYAIGAVAADGEVYANPVSGYTAEDTRNASGPALAKVRHLIAEFRAGLPPLSLEDRTAVVVDDGLATGLTALAAVEYIRRAGALRIVLAVPVAAPGAVPMLAQHVDEVIAIEEPVGFSAVGQLYGQFGQTDDAEVRALLADASRRALRV